MAEPISISSFTGEQFYSGDWTDIRDLLRVLNIGDGLLSKISQALVERVQESVDRQIDGLLSDLYWTPIRTFNVASMKVGADDVKQFPGDLRQAARYLVCGQLLTSEFQGLEQNNTDQAQSFEAKGQAAIFEIRRPHNRLQGQRRKSNISRTMPPNMQMSDLPERG